MIIYIPASFPIKEVTDNLMGVLKEGWHVTSCKFIQSETLTDFIKIGIGKDNEMV